MLGLEMPQNSQPGKLAFPFASKQKPQQFLPLSDEDEPGFAPDEGGATAGDDKRKMSPWQRMKWTDNMVQLLIMAVYYIGDEVGSEGPDPAAAAGKKKPAGLLQKKGKWKSVSRAMMEKGFYVSPQQCEDKFNDLNKRYKRVNDLLGKGTACRVVENQSLLETMDHLSTKMKEEVRKLLNSKHLFFREMCAYHTSCSGGGGGGAGSAAGELSHPLHGKLDQQQHRCLPLPCNASGGLPIMRQAETQAPAKGGGTHDADDEDSEDDTDNDDDDDGDEDGGGEDFEGFTAGGLITHGHDEGDENDGRNGRKRPRKEMDMGQAQQLWSEVANVLQDGARSTWEKRKWIKKRMVQVEEQQLGCQLETLELEKQRLKWLKYSAKKEMEMEMGKLKNERMRLATERMVLLLRQKEMELLDRQPNLLNKEGQ